MSRSDGRLSLLAPTALAFSVAWLAYEVVQRVVPPRRFDEQGRVEELFERDPKLGAALPVALPKNQGGRVAYVWLGDCNQCSSRALPSNQLQAACPKGTQLVLLSSVTTTDRSIIVEDARKIKLSKSQQNRINAFFAPRVYIVRDGKLERVQDQSESPLEVIQG